MQRTLAFALTLFSPLSALAQTDTSSAASPVAGDHEVVLEDISQRADDLERRIAEVSRRVLLLRESVVLGKVAPTQVLIAHKNEMGASFRLEELTYWLDGKQILARSDKEGILDTQRQFELLNGSLRAGEHEIRVSAVFAGSGFGLFTYLKGYRFKVDSKYKFIVAEGRLTRLDVVAYEKSDITLEPKDRLAVRYDYEVSVPVARRAE